MLKTGYKGVPTTSPRLTYRDRAASTAISEPIQFWWSFLAVSILFVLVGFYILFVDREEWIPALGCIILFGSAAVFGYMIRLKRATDLFPIRWDRFFDFKSIELVRMGKGRARITRVTQQKVEYIDEAGHEQFVDLEECARIWMCLECSRLFPPGNERDWGRLADATPDFSKLDVSGSGTVGLRGALDSPPWFQFLDRRRTQFQFKSSRRFETQLLRPLGKVGWQSFDAC